MKLPRKDGKQSNIESPVTSEFGMLLIAYVVIDKEIYVNADISQILLNCARPKNGVEVPIELQTRPFPWKKFQAHVLSKINRRRSCSKFTTSPEQLSLF